MERLANIFVSIVVVMDEYSADTGRRVKSLTSLLKKSYSNYEIIIIDNGLIANELEQTTKLLPTLPCIRVIRLSRNHDTDTAIFAGVEASIGDYVCLMYNNDPIELVTEFVDKSKKYDIVFGVARNLLRNNYLEHLGAKAFYWYSKRYLGLKVPKRSTYFMCMNRSVANALTRSGRFMRHIRHMAQGVGFSSTTLEYDLPEDARIYNHFGPGTLASRAIDLVSNYSSHPLRAVSYFGLLAGLLNILYAFYVITVNFSDKKIAKGWTTLSLQTSLMFFMLFIILAVLAEYIGKILNETQQEPPYHIMQELSSSVNVADETRRNVTK